MARPRRDDRSPRRRDDGRLAASARRVADALRGGRAVSDAAFDAHLPDALRAASWRHFTPVAVAVQAAELFAQAGAAAVLDVGSGAGKFAVVAALAQDLAVVGVEQREELVSAARRLAARFDVSESVDFLQGDLSALPQEGFDGLYLFNPFGERLAADEDARYREDVERVEALLARAPVGTVLVAYHGFGGEVPPGWELEVERPAGTEALRRWRKRS